MSFLYDTTARGITSKFLLKTEEKSFKKAIHKTLKNKM